MMKKNSTKMFDQDIMIGFNDRPKNYSNKTPSEQFSELTEISIRSTHRDDKDFDEAFKHLLRPIELISKRIESERSPLQYNLLKELDSYLVHLKKNSDDDYTQMFTKAAIMFQNIIFLYQKRVDQACNDMMKLIGRLQAYRINQEEKNHYENRERNKKNNKKNNKERNVKYYSSFEPIKLNVMPSLRKFDCKLVDMRKYPPLPKAILNTNIKINKNYCQTLPYIFTKNGETIGLKYDFLINYSLNGDLAVDEQFDCPTQENKNLKNSLLVNSMDVDETEFNNILPNGPDTYTPDLFNQSIDKMGNEVCVRNTKSLPADPGNVVNVNEIPLMINDNENKWLKVTKPVHDIYSDVPIIPKRVHKHEENVIWIPSFVIEDFCEDIPVKLKMNKFSDCDPVFRDIIYKVQKAQRLEILQYRNNLVKEKTPDIVELDNTDYCDDIFAEVENPESLENYNKNFETYQKDMNDMSKYEELQLQTMNEQLEMRKRVEDWHDKLRPILEDDEIRSPFDVHEYGSRVLNCFKLIGEQKSFKDLFGGLVQEEVSRYFLSILMMINTGNLKIQNEVGYEIIMKLLKKESNNEEL